MPTNNLSGIPEEVIISRIYLVRGQRVMIDRDMADLYGSKQKD
jgi:hypothetical protein